MSDLANYAEDVVSNWVGGKSDAPAVSAGRYLALYTAVSDAEAGTGTEVSGVNYARVSIASLLGTSSSGAITNTSAIEFAVAGAGGWGTITHAGIRDAATAGNAITAIKALSASVAIAENDVFRIQVGDLDYATA